MFSVSAGVPAKASSCLPPQQKWNWRL